MHRNLLVADADNTLWDTDAIFATAHLRLLRHVEKSLGIRSRSNERLAFVRQIDERILRTHAGDLGHRSRLLVEGIAESISQRFNQADWRNHINVSECVALFLSSFAENDPPLRPRVSEGMYQLHSHGVRIVVATEGDGARTHDLLSQYDLAGIVVDVISATKSPDFYRALRSTFENDTDRWFCVGDRGDRDIQFAKQAGFTTIHFPAPFRHPSDAAALPVTADHQIRTFDELIPIICVSHHESVRRPKNSAILPNPQTAPTYSAPPSIDWWITTLCNLACPFCYGPAPDSGEDRSHVFDVLTKICRSKSPVVTLCGGEPLVASETPRVVDELAKHGKRVIINTNGELLTRAAASRLGLGKNVQVLGLSIDGGTSRVHRLMRGAQADLSKTLSACKLAQQLPGLKIKIASVISAVNIEFVEELAYLVDTLGPSVWRIYQYTRRGVGVVRSDHHELDDDTFLDTVHRIRRAFPTIRIRHSTRHETDGCFIVDHRGAILQPYLTDYVAIGNCLSEDVDAIWNTKWQIRAKTLANKQWIQLTSEGPLN